MNMTSKVQVQRISRMQNALADLLGPVIQPVLEGEMSEHLGYGAV